MPHRYKAIKEKWIDNEAYKTLSDEKLQELYNDLSNLQTIYKNLQMAVKLSANSLYGASGNEHWRFCNYEIASDITGEGAHMMIAGDKAINNYYQKWMVDAPVLARLKEEFPNQADNLALTPVKFDVCNYGDTDSRYIEYKEIFRAAGFVPKSVDEVIKFILIMDEMRIGTIFDRVLKHEVGLKNGKSTLKMELEVIGGRGIFMKKKKYVMSILWKDGKNIAQYGKIKAIGVELKRRTSSLFVKDMQEKVIRKILNPNFQMNEIYALTAMIVKHAQSVDVTQLCTITSLNDYEKFVANDKDKLVFNKGSKPWHRAAAAWNQLLYKHNMLDKMNPLGSGDKIKWYRTGVDKREVAFPVNLLISEMPEWMPPMHYGDQIEALFITPITRYLPVGSARSNVGKSTIQNSFG